MLFREHLPFDVASSRLSGDSIRDHLVKQLMEAHDEEIDADSADKLAAGRSRRPLFRAKRR